MDAEDLFLRQRIGARQVSPRDGHRHGLAAGQRAAGATGRVAGQTGRAARQPAQDLTSAGRLQSLDTSAKLRSESLKSPNRGVASLWEYR